MIGFKQYQTLCKHSARVPLVDTLPADQETPVSLYARRNKKRGSFLLESVVGGDQISRYSFIGLDPLKLCLDIRKLAPPVDNPLKDDPYFLDLPPLHAGAIGYLSYRWIQNVEPTVPQRHPDKLGWPEMAFFETDALLALDHAKQQLLLMAQTYPAQATVREAYRQGQGLLKKLHARLRKKPRLPDFTLPEQTPKLSFNFKSFQRKLNRAQTYIKNGDIFQVVLSQRFEKKLAGDPFLVYRALRMINPSPYLFYLEFPFGSLIGSSPEIMVRLQDRKAVLRPIAGTRPRGQNPGHEAKLQAELLADQKELAEHTMLVDLGRNDLGRVCLPGTVKPTDLMVIEKYSHVMHIVSHVEGTLQPGKNYFDLLAAAFPAGTVSGAPKIRAMEIIDELEDQNRGPYAGSVLYLDHYGNLDSCIAIRTLFTQGRHIYFQAGAGIVSDSNAENEYREIIHKASALAKACAAR